MNEIKIPMKIGGWLVIVAIGVLIAPIKIAYYLWVDHIQIFFDGTWQEISDPSGDSYSSLLVYLIVGEILFNVAMFFVSMYLIALLLKKSKKFPIVFFIVSLVTVSFIAFSYGVLSYSFPAAQVFDDAAIKDNVWVLVDLFIWSPYIIFSKRGKETFAA